MSIVSDHPHIPIPTPVDLVREILTADSDVIADGWPNWSADVHQEITSIFVSVFVDNPGAALDSLPAEVRGAFAPVLADLVATKTAAVVASVDSVDVYRAGWLDGYRDVYRSTWLDGYPARYRADASMAYLAGHRSGQRSREATRLTADVAHLGARWSSEVPWDHINWPTTVAGVYAGVTP